jgi:hypothetical protein
MKGAEREPLHPKRSPSVTTCDELPSAETFKRPPTVEICHRLPDVKTCDRLPCVESYERMCEVIQLSRLLSFKYLNNPPPSEEINRDIHGDQNDDDPLQESSVFVVLFFGQHVQHVLQGRQFLAQNFDALLQI